MTSAFYLLLGLPVLFSLGIRGAEPKVLCFLCSVFAVLLSGGPGGALLPWAIGMMIAAVGLHERFRRNPRLSRLVAGDPADRSTK